MVRFGKYGPLVAAGLAISSLAPGAAQSEENSLKKTVSETHIDASPNALVKGLTELGKKVLTSPVDMPKVLEEAQKASLLDDCMANAKTPLGKGACRLAPDFEKARKAGPGPF